MIIRGDENIDPKEIEDVVAGDPSVLETAVIGVPDDKWGEVVVAYVHPDEAASSTRPTCGRGVRRASAATSAQLPTSSWTPSPRTP
jgi:acyl-CoA synthetase (AMP-forming)/AMP-acid ligase II